MNYSLNVKKDFIDAATGINLYSGNVNTYTFSFNMDDSWNEYIKFGIFIKNGRAYNVKLEGVSLKVPQEILSGPGEVSFGLFGTNGDNDIKRISTNLIEFKVSQGAYKSSESPKVSGPDFWEAILSKYIPRIIDEKWHIYDVKSDSYTDTGINAGASWNEKVGKIESALDSIIKIQNELIGGDGV